MVVYHSSQAWNIGSHNPSSQALHNDVHIRLSPRRHRSEAASLFQVVLQQTQVVHVPLLRCQDSIETIMIVMYIGYCCVVYRFISLVSFRLFSHKFYVLSPQFFPDHTNEACDLTMISMMIQWMWSAWEEAKASWNVSKCIQTILRCLWIPHHAKNRHFTLTTPKNQLHVKCRAFYMNPQRAKASCIMPGGFTLEIWRFTLRLV